MSLSSLKKSTHSDRPRLVTVDQFIDEAVNYSLGHNCSAQSRKLQVVPCSDTDTSNKNVMRRATYTLTPEIINKLTELAERTGVAKSRLIRILVDQHMQNEDDANILASHTR